MNSIFKQRLVKSSKWFAGIFVLIFLFRFLYGYTLSTQSDGEMGYEDFFSNVTNLRKNYASENNFKGPVNNQQQGFSNSQKYEKTASVKTRSSEFETDEKKVKSVTSGYAGVIQFEKNTGKKGHREIHLSIGIDPVKFDSFYLQIQSIGTVTSREITKVDKTNEYLQLNAKKASFEKTLLSLNELKSRGGAIGDYVTLHDKILEIEGQMQGLGVELGNFDAVNEFCTVQFSIYEGAPEKAISLFHRIKVAFEWSIKFYAIAVIAYLVFILAVFITILVIEKLKIFGNLAKITNE